MLVRFLILKNVKKKGYDYLRNKRLWLNKKENKKDEFELVRKDLSIWRNSR